MQKRWATTSKEIGLSKPILQRTATPRNRCRRIVAPKVAGSIPVGHPFIYRIGKRKTWGRKVLGLKLADDEVGGAHGLTPLRCRYHAATHWL